MRREIICSKCEKRSGCKSPCRALADVLRREEKHFQGREILVSPATITSIFANGNATSLADFITEEVHESEIRIIPGLTDRQMRILTMSVVDRKSHRTIAKTLGLNQSTVGEHMIAARRKARRFIEESVRAKKWAKKPAPGLGEKEAG
jgi:DNA-directed RNA polymerase specialized sigma24 family protein